MEPFSSNPQDLHHIVHLPFTLGYGGFAQYGGDKNQRYTSSFNGTSSASGLVAPAVAVAVDPDPCT